MIDYFTIALTHGLMAIALWRLLWRDDLDRDTGNASARRRPRTKNDGGDTPPANGTG